jgi:hypothetical protein
MNSKVLFLSSLVLIFFLNFFTEYIDAYYYTILIYIGINIILATSLNLINGYTGQFSLGHAGFMAIGGYLSIAVSTYFAPFFMDTFGTELFGQTISFIIVLLIGGTAAAIAGIIVGVPGFSGARKAIGLGRPAINPLHKTRVRVESSTNSCVAGSRKKDLPPKRPGGASSLAFWAEGSMPAAGPRAVRAASALVPSS